VCGHGGPAFPGQHGVPHALVGTPNPRLDFPSLAAGKTSVSAFSVCEDMQTTAMKNVKLAEGGCFWSVYAIFRFLTDASSCCSR
jgi:hypothetical protein